MQYYVILRAYSTQCAQVDNPFGLAEAIQMIFQVQATRAPFEVSFASNAQGVVQATGDHLRQYLDEAHLQMD